MLTYVGVPKGSESLSHYGRLGMKWGQHIFGDDPRWGRNGRGKKIGHIGTIFKTQFGDYDTDVSFEKRWSHLDEWMREAYYQDRDKRLTLSKLKKSTTKLSSPPTYDEVESLIKKINPHRDDPDADEKGYRNNCVKCSICTVLSLKGYDARAYAQENNLGHPSVPGNPDYSFSKALDLSRTAGGSASFPQTRMPTKYNPNKHEAEKMRKRYVNGANEINKHLKDGDYGIIDSTAADGNGHASNFIKINGRTYGIDGQMGKIEPLEDYFDDVGWCLSSHRFIVCNDAKPREVGVGRFVDEEKFKK